jgi:hypothetical protein
MLQSSGHSPPLGQGLTSLLAAYSLRERSEAEDDDRRGADETSGVALAGRPLSNDAVHAASHMIRRLDEVPDVNVPPRHVI